ncbi:MAG: ATP-binding protein [Oligoflexia bacterium]|nr:ATP-binding protein [Oligoflexia bacterium]
MKALIEQRRLILFFGLLSLAMCLLALWVEYIYVDRIHEDSLRYERESKELHVFSSSIRVMDMSLKMLVFTGNQEWENSFFQASNELRKSLEHIRTEESLMQKKYALDLSYNVEALVNFDTKIIELMHQNKKEQAKEKLSSLARERMQYQLWKKLQNSENFLQKASLEARLEKSGEIAKIILIIALVLILVGTIWIFLFRLIIRLNDELTMFSRELDVKVKEKTRELEESQAFLVNSSKMAAMGEMAGGIAHEINNPLATIQIKIEQLVEMCASSQVDKTEVHKRLEAVTRLVDRIAKIIQSMRVIGRDSAKDPLTSVGLFHLIEEALVIFQEKFRSLGFSVEIDDSCKSLHIMVNETHFLQVISNLIHNAIDASLEGKTQRWIKFRAEIENDYCKLYVSDSGSGIHESVEKKLFQPFFTTKDVGKGLGIGLSISKKLMQQQKGDLTYSNKFKNTTFIVLVKLERKGVQNAAE